MAGFRIGPAPARLPYSAAGEAGRPPYQRQTVDNKARNPPFRAIFHRMWISWPDILGADGARTSADRYDRGTVAATLSSGSPPRFAHQSEAELARILDFYQVQWRYEPDTFPLSWNAAGAVVESFSPDFYLPEVDLYLELTTLRQSLVRRKNRKLRWLRQLYPEIRVKLFYARDFKALMVKYGRLDFLADVTAKNGNGPLNDAYGGED